MDYYTKMFINVATIHCIKTFFFTLKSHSTSFTYNCKIFKLAVFTYHQDFSKEMNIFRTLLWTAIVAIEVERCRVEFLLVEVNDAPGKGKLCFSFL